MTTSFSRRAAAGAMIAISTLLAEPAVPQSAPVDLTERSLLSAAESFVDPQFGVEPMIARTRSVEVDFEVLGELRRAGLGSVQLELFRGVRVELALDRSFQDLPDRFTAWTGTVAGERGSFTSLIYKPGLLLANVVSPRHGSYQVRRVLDGGHVVREIDLEALPRCGAQDDFGPGLDHTLREAGAPPADPGAGTGSYADDGSILDVMVVFTKRAQDAAGGIDAMNGLAELSIIETNVCLEQSEVDLRMRLVYKGKIVYDESGTFEEALSRLRSTSDGYMDEVHGIRDAVGADFVALLTNEVGLCGIAYLYTGWSGSSYAFSVTKWSCATAPVYAFPHELGHNMGCAHDRPNAGGSGYDSYSYGHTFFGDNGREYGTIMSYEGQAIRYFSNPDVVFQGQPTGIASGSDSANNAQTIRNTKFALCNFRDERNQSTGLLFSLLDAKTVEGVALDPGDIAMVDFATGAVTLQVDLGDVIPANPNTDAFARRDNGNYLLSFADAVDIPGLAGGPSGTTVGAEDIVEFTPTSLGENTAGSFAFLFDGSDVNLDTLPQENVDAITLDDAGNLLISFQGPWDLGALSGKDEDVQRFLAFTLGANTSGLWQTFFDGSGSDEKLDQNGEDVDACHFHPLTGDLTVSVRALYRVPQNQTGNDKDLITFLDGDGLWMQVLDGKPWGIKGPADIDGVQMLE